MRIVLSQGAQRDFQEGLRWYRKRSDQAAERFIAAMEELIERIGAHPERFRLVADTLRKAHFKPFPYSLIRSQQNLCCCPRQTSAWVLAAPNLLTHSHARQLDT